MVLVGSRQGGVDIESVAKETPEAIIKQPVDIISGNYLRLLCLCFIGCLKPCAVYCQGYGIAC